MAVTERMGWMRCPPDHRIPGLVGQGPTACMEFCWIRMHQLWHCCDFLDRSK